MQVEEGKKAILEILGNTLKFDGHFSKCFDNLKETQQQELVQWVKDCKEYKTNPIPSKINRGVIGFVRLLEAMFGQS